MDAVAKKGEDAACRHLISLGHSILERNWRSAHYEIDIISADGRGLHFVEVKSRMAPSAADPEANITAAKRRNIVNGALRYLHSEGRRFPDAEVSFDVITVLFDRNTTYIQYYPQAFIPFYA